LTPLYSLLFYKSYDFSRFYIWRTLFARIEFPERNCKSLLTRDRGEKWSNWIDWKEGTVNLKLSTIRGWKNFITVILKFMSVCFFSKHIDHSNTSFKGCSWNFIQYTVCTYFSCDNQHPCYSRVGFEPLTYGIGHFSFYCIQRALKQKLLYKLSWANKCVVTVFVLFSSMNIFIYFERKNKVLNSRRTRLIIVMWRRKVWSLRFYRMFLSL
jgi:hypothetical protein